MARTLGIHSREPFDRTREFRVLRQMILAGRVYVTNEAFPKTLVNDRRLRQLYDQRYLQMVPLDPVPLDTNPAPVIEKEVGSRPDFADMTNQQLTQYLTDHGVTPRHGWKRPQLLQRAEQAWVNGTKTA
jgi:hypothetical protein